MDKRYMPLEIGGNEAFGVLMAATIGGPLYACGGGTIPLLQAWLMDGMTLIRCKIIGTQPLCYCRNLKLVDCEMVDTGLAFEKSEVDAVITTKVDSIKNPLSGRICVPEVGEVIMDDQLAKGEVRIGGLKEGKAAYTIPSEKTA